MVVFLRVSFCLLLILFSSLSYSQTLKLKLKVGKSYQDLNWPSKSEFKWEKNTDGVFVFYQMLSLDVPQQFEIKKAVSKSRNLIKVSPDGRNLKIKFYSNADKILFLTKSGKKHTIIINFENTKLLEEFSKDCEKENLFLSTQKKIALPFPVAMRCYLKNTTPYFAVVVPSDVDWLSTTISERRGKGEVWKEYEVADIPAGDNELRGQFTFGYLNKEYKVDLKSKKTITEKPVEEIIKS